MKLVRRSAAAIGRLGLARGVGRRVDILDWKTHAFWPGIGYGQQPAVSSDAIILARDARAHSETTDGDGRSDPSWLVMARSMVLIFLAWTCVGVFLAVPDTFMGFHWPAFMSKVVDAWAWALLTPALLLIDRKLASMEQNIGRLTLLFLLLSVPFSLMHTYVCGLLLLAVPGAWWNPLLRPDFAVYYFLGGWQTFSALVGIVYAFKYYNRFLTSRLQLERVEKSLLGARLNALRLQLEPHFLFNALNTISSEVTTNPNLARDMIGDLGALLRQSLDCKDRTEITLAQELSLLDHYLSIQRIRFGDRMEIGIDVEPETLSILVPSMLLQPLVENAIRHGIEGRLSGGKIMISAWRAGDQLQIRVLDDGVGLPPNWRMDASTGLGVRVARERLAALYPGLGEQGFVIRRREGGGTEVAISVPVYRAGSDEA
jgi:two-component system LytT family sensor kinase